MLGLIIPIIVGFIIGILVHIILKVNKNNPKVERTITIITKN